MPKSTLYIIGIVVIVLAIFGGSFYTGFEFGKKSLKDELDKAQEIIDAYRGPVPETVLNLSGEIKEIGDAFLNLEVSDSVFEGSPLPGEDPEKLTLKVIIGDETKILKTPEGAFGALEQEEIELDKLEVGTWVYVSSKENIKGKTEFLADVIELQGETGAITPRREAPELSPEDLPAPIPEGETGPAPIPGEPTPLEEDLPAPMP